MTRRGVLDVAIDDTQERRVDPYLGVRAFQINFKRNIATPVVGACIERRLAPPRRPRSAIESA